MWFCASNHLVPIPRQEVTCTLRPVGVIANPASGKDIRRLVAYGSVFDNHEKVNIVRRVLLGLDAMGVEEVFFMPDVYGIGIRAKEDLDVGLHLSFLDMPMEGQQEDSSLAAALLRERGAGCILTLGGDGTNRAVAKTCGDVPILPISTGTNNVFPTMVEGTLAGMAAGIAAGKEGTSWVFLRRAPRLDILKDGVWADMALVDVVVARPGFVGSRALWEVEHIREVFLARAEPEHIGFSSIGGLLGCGPVGEGKGMHLVIGPGGSVVRAPIAPGLVRAVPVRSHEVFEAGRTIPVTETPGLIALDGEREWVLRKGEIYGVELNPKGPWVVSVTEALRWGAERGVFVANP